MKNENQNSQDLYQQFYLSINDMYVPNLRKIIKNKNFDPNYSFLNNLKPIHYASIISNKALIKLLIKKKANVKAVDDNNSTALHFASENGHLEVVKYLIKKKADIDSTLFFHYTPLFLATKNGHFEVVQYLITLDPTDYDFRTTLHIAAENGHLKIVKYLIEEKEVNISIKGFQQETAFHFATSGGSLKTVKYLIKKGANINDLTLFNNTGLHFAAEKGHTKVIKWLIKNDASINIPENYKGFTALHNATINDHLEIVKCLIKNQADINATTFEGKTSLHFAVEANYFKIIECLVRNGINVKAKDHHNVTALHLATKKGDIEIIKYLVDNGANINARDKKGCSALYFASSDGNLAIVEYLIERGANVNGRDRDNLTILHYAARNGHLEIVEYLLTKAGISLTHDISTYTFEYTTNRDKVVLLLETAKKADEIFYNSLAEIDLTIISRGGELQTLFIERFKFSLSQLYANIDLNQFKYMLPEPIFNNLDSFFQEQKEAIKLHEAAILSNIYDISPVPLDELLSHDTQVFKLDAENIITKKTLEFYKKRYPELSNLLSNLLTNKEYDHDQLIKTAINMSGSYLEKLTVRYLEEKMYENQHVADHILGLNKLFLPRKTLTNKIKRLVEKYYEYIKNLPKKELEKEFIYPEISNDQDIQTNEDFLKTSEFYHYSDGTSKQENLIPVLGIGADMID